MLEKQPDRNKCIVCQCQCQRQSDISVLGWLICTECEIELVKSNVNHHGYDKYVKSLRTIWQTVSWEDVPLFV
ncbi:MAG: hypothetical protein GX316_11470 [Firmicutes bacterium]|nr:hypothetical protein [Bacillota bacterium]